jgi:hypothetical protein
MKKSELRQLIREEISLLKGASKETLARDTEESDREYIIMRQKRNRLAQKNHGKDYRELDPTEKMLINKELKK